MFRSQDIYIFVILINSQSSKSMTRHTHYYTLEVTLSLVFFRTIGIIKMKLGQISVHFLTNHFSLLLTLLLKMETSSRTFYRFQKMVR